MYVYKVPESTKNPINLQISDTQGKVDLDQVIINIEYIAKTVYVPWIL